MLDKIFLCYYRGFTKSGNQTPVFAAANVLTLAEIGIIFLSLVLLKLRHVYDLTSVENLKIFYIIFHLLLLVVQYRYYKGKNPVQMHELFEKISDSAKIVWRILAMLVLVIPILTIIVLLA